MKYYSITLNKRILFLFVVFLQTNLLFPDALKHTYSDPELLRNKIQILLSKYPARYGISIEHSGTKDTIHFNRDGHFPMQSVYKFQLALHVFHQVDLKLLTLDQLVKVSKKELVKNTWSPMRDDKKVSSFEISIRDLLQYSVSQSDNIACDVLFRISGGP